MTESERGLPHYLRMALVLLALLAAVIVPLIFVFGAFSVKFGLLSWRTGLDLVVTWLPRAAFSALALGILSFVLSIFIRPRGRGLPLAALAIVIPGAVLFQAAQIKAAAQAVPPIHDISTDMQNPPHFSQALIALREASGAENSLDYEGKSVNRGGDPRQVSELQRQAYPDIKPIALNVIIGQEDGTAVLAAPHFIGVFRASQLGGVKARADLHPLGGVDRHAGRGQLRIQLAINRRPPAGGNAAGDHFHHRTQ